MNIQIVKEFQDLSFEFPMKKYRKKIQIDTDFTKNRVYGSQLSVSESLVAKRNK